MTKLIVAFGNFAKAPDNSKPALWSREPRDLV